jgi:hypothetical protein
VDVLTVPVAASGTNGVLSFMATGVEVGTALIAWLSFAAETMTVRGTRQQ